MNVHPLRADSPAMTDEEQVPTGQERRVARALAQLQAEGFKSGHQLTKATGMSRPTITKILAGEPITVTSASRFIEAAERILTELGSERDDLPMATQADAGLIEFHVTGNFGIEVVVKCAPDQLEATVQAVEALVERMGQRS